ncbi:DUF7563 family protein [Natrinema sp. CGMCC1.2065]|uniref:DUF7563 family protein n=1 Tax=Natrinema sp. CGMCC1.2065 TaxID=3445767 RepID=UPI003F4A1F45
MQRWDVRESPQRCLCCGSHVTPQFRRSAGDERDRAHRCHNCDIHGRISEGSAAGKEVDHPDPLEQPERFEGSFAELPEQVRAVVAEVATDGGEPADD